MENIVDKSSNSSIKTSLNGVVVTPNTQQTNHADNIYSLDFLLTDNMICKFRKHTFPIIHKSKDGIFMQPTQHIITPMENIYVKWLFIGSDYKPSHDHNYPVAKLKESGYFMRITASTFSDKDFIIDYIQDVTKIETLTIKNVTMTKSVTDTYKDLDMLIIRPYQVGVDDELIKNIITDREMFFDTYLKDVFNS